MSFKFTTAVFKANLPKKYKEILRALAERANDDGICWPSHQRIAADAGCSRATVKVNLKPLIEVGLVSITGHKKSSHGEVNVYTLHLAAINNLTGVEMNRVQNEPGLNLTPTGVVSKSNRVQNELLNQSTGNQSLKQSDGTVAGGVNNKFQFRSNPILTTIAVLQHLQAMTGDMPSVTSPIIPFLTSLSEEFLEAHKDSPLSLYDEKTDTTYEVAPGDPRYPDLDDGLIEGGLSLRESATVAAYSHFTFSCDVLAGLEQYIPIGDEATMQGNIRHLLSALGWPNDYCHLSVALLHAVAWWAFKKSNFWPSRITTVERFCNSLPVLLSQYEKYYASLPEDKKPHSIGAGRPVRQE
jgi:hypothetical protein